jgi:hypothetical protein
VDLGAGLDGVKKGKNIYLCAYSVLHCTLTRREHSVKSEFQVFHKSCLLYIIPILLSVLQQRSFYNLCYLTPDGSDSCRYEAVNK